MTKFAGIEFDLDKELKLMTSSKDDAALFFLVEVCSMAFTEIEETPKTEMAKQT